MNEPTAWTIEHFSLANPKGRGQGNVPLLLRRVADVIEGFGTAEVQDLLLHAEVNEFGDWPSITVYFHRGQAACGHLRRRVLSPDRSPAARDRPAVVTLLA